jgi:hypothetical protein
MNFSSKKSSSNDLLQQLYKDLESIEVGEGNDSFEENKSEEKDDEEILRLKRELLDDGGDILEEDEDWKLLQMEATNYFAGADSAAEEKEMALDTKTPVVLNQTVSSFSHESGTFLNAFTNETTQLRLMPDITDENIGHSSEILELMDSLLESIEYLALFNAQHQALTQPLQQKEALPVSEIIKIPELIGFNEEQQLLANQIDNDSIPTARNEREQNPAASLLEEEAGRRRKIEQMENQYELEIKQAYETKKKRMEEELKENEQRKLKRQELMLKILQDSKSVRTFPLIAIRLV